MYLDLYTYQNDRALLHETSFNTILEFIAPLHNLCFKNLTYILKNYSIIFLKCLDKVHISRCTNSRFKKKEM